MQQSKQEDLLMEDVANRPEEMRRSIKSTVSHVLFCFFIIIISAWIFLAKAPLS